jgi:acetyl-CoA synthetase
MRQHIHGRPISGSRNVAESAWADAAKYEEMYKRSLADPEAFWGEQAKRIDWIKPFTKVKDVNFNAPNVHIKWFHDGTLNVSYNCLDRHLAKRGSQTAILWEADDPAKSEAITYKDLHERVCRLANALKARASRRATSSPSICR